MENIKKIEEVKSIGFYNIVLIRDGFDEEEIEFNKVVDQGLINLLNVGLAGGTQITQWYIGLYTNNYSPVAGDTLSTLLTNAPEFTAYSETNRQQWTPTPATSTPTLSNSGFEAVFTATSAGTVRGAFLASSSGKNATTGTLFSAALFGADRVLQIGDKLKVTYTVTATSS